MRFLCMGHLPENSVISLKLWPLKSTKILKDVNLEINLYFLWYVKQNFEINCVNMETHLQLCVYKQPSKT